MVVVTWDPCLILRLRCWVNDMYRQSVDSCRAGMAVPSCAFGHDSQPWLHNRVIWGSFEKITESGSHPRPIKSVSWWGPGGTAWALRVPQMELTSAGLESADPEGVCSGILKHTCCGDAGVRMANVETVPAVCFGTRNEIQPGQGVHRHLMYSESAARTSGWELHSTTSFYEMFLMI